VLRMAFRKNHPSRHTALRSRRFDREGVALVSVGTG
jgi:hypothetical protein